MTGKRTDFPISHASSIFHSKHKGLLKQFCQAMEKKTQQPTKTGFFLNSSASECVLYKQAPFVVLQETELTVMLGRVGKGGEGGTQLGALRGKSCRTQALKSHRK